LKVVIDTNVYISSLLFKGKAREVYDICISNTDVFISGFIVAELSYKLSNKFSIPSKAVKEIIKSILSVVEVAEINTKLPNVCRDIDDNEILQLCESISADFLVTGDKDLLILKKYKSTRIVDPSQFINSVV